jgi:hypothetical protein
MLVNMDQMAHCYDTMKHQIWKSRWNSGQATVFLNQFKAAAFSGNGANLSRSPFGNVEENGLADFRGLPLANGFLRRTSVKFEPYTPTIARVVPSIL